MPRLLLSIRRLFQLLREFWYFTPLRNEERVYRNKEGYIIVTGIWLIFSLFSTLPFLFSGSISNFGDAFFESMSGFTTTGATIIPNVESMPHGILFWRSLTQWLGGIGIILISLSVIPVLKSLNIQLAATEFTGLTSNKIHPRTKDTAIRLLTIYLALTLAETIFLIFRWNDVFLMLSVIHFRPFLPVVSQHGMMGSQHYPHLI